MEAGFHQRAIRLVARGRVDAAAIDSQVLAVELRDHPRLAASLRVIGTFGPSTIQPVVATSRLPDQLKTAVRDMLLGLGRNAETEPALARGFIQGFVAIGDGDYDGIGAMLDASTPPATPPPSASKATRRWRSRAGPPDPRRGGRGLSITLTPQPCWLT